MPQLMYRDPTTGSWVPFVGSSPGSPIELGYTTLSSDVTGVTQTPVNFMSVTFTVTKTTRVGIRANCFAFKGAGDGNAIGWISLVMDSTNIPNTQRNFNINTSSNVVVSTEGRITVAAGTHTAYCAGYNTASYINFSNQCNMVVDNEDAPIAGGQSVPSGGSTGYILAKNSANDYDVGWTGDPSVNTLSASGNINSTGQSTFGQMDMRRNNAGAAVAALQNVGTFRGLGWDGVSAYQVLGAISFPAEQTVSPSQAGGAIQFQTTPNGAIGTVARMRVGQNGKVQIPGAMQLGQPVLTDPAVGTVLDLSNGLMAQRRQAYTVVAGNNNNLTLPTSTFIEFTATATTSFNITGFAGGQDGMEIDFIWLGAATSNVTFNHQSASSTAANQITTLSGVDENLLGPCSGTLRYSSSVSKWILVNFIGKSSQAGTTVSEKQMSITSGWGSGVVSSYALVGNQPANWGQITKKYSGTNWIVECGASCWLTTAANMCYIGVSPTSNVGNLTQVAQFFFNETGTHRAFTGMCAIFGNAAGGYNFSAYVRVPAGSSLNTDGNDQFWMKVREVWP